MPTISSEAAITARRSSASEPKPCEIQVATITPPITTPTSTNSAAQQQAVLEAKARAHAIEPGVLLAHEVGAVGVRAQPEREHLGADDHQQRAADQRVQPPGAPEEVEAGADEHDDQRAQAGEQRRRAR